MTGADLYDKVMDGIQATIGDDRYKDVLAHNGDQIENLFSQFGGQDRSFSIERNQNGKYKVFDETRVGKGRTSYNWNDMDLETLNKRYPDFIEYIPMN